MIPTLLSFLSPEHPASVQTSAGDFLKAIITISANATQNDQSCIGPNSLTRELVSAPCVETLINAMLQGGNPLTVGVGIVIEVIRKNNSDYDPEPIGGPDSMPNTYDPIYLGTLLRSFAQHIPDFMALIRSSKHTVNDAGEVKSVDRGELNSAWGARIEPLGFDRFKTCELMAELLHCSNMGLLNEPGSDEYVWHRDAERERLIREGIFNSPREVTSYNESTTDFTGSVLAGGVPHDRKVLEVTNVDEDGFEDVGSSEVYQRERGFEESNSQEPGNEQTPQDSVTVSERETGPESQTAVETEQAANTSTDTNTSSPDPTKDLTDQTSKVNLDSNQPSQTHGSQTPSKIDSDEISASLQSGQSEKEMSAPMSSHPEDIPPPLFASKQPEAPGPGGLTGDSPDTTAPATSATEQTDPFIQMDTTGQPVVGDYLKIMFVQNRVVPTILVSLLH